MYTKHSNIFFYTLNYYERRKPTKNRNVIVLIFFFDALRCHSVDYGITTGIKRANKH